MDHAALTTFNSPQPILTTERFVLRPFSLSDAKQVQLLAGDALIAATTANIPHPYEDGMAEKWIATHADMYQQGSAVQFAVILKQTNTLIGCMSFFGISKINSKAEIGYWVGVDFWNKGYCTEAAKSLVKYGFETLNLNKITARYVSTNLGSRRVMEKIGMKQEGYFRQDSYKDGKFHDMVIFGLLREEYSGF